MNTMGNDTFHIGKYYISFKRNLEDYKKDITIAIKVFENDSLRILLSDDEDPSFLCVLNVTRSDYVDLKKQQGLLIDFDNFPGQLVKLLQQCAANNMFLVLQQSNAAQFYFEIVEHNEFRRLVHLSLKTAPASDSDIKKHMAETINYLKKSLASYKHSASSNDTLWNEKYMNMERKLQDLNMTVSKMEEDKLRRESEFQETLRRERDRMAQERLDWHKNIEITSKSQSSAMQEIINRKEKQIEECNSQCKQLQDKLTKLERQFGDKCQRLSLLEREMQSAHIDTATVKARNANLERDILEKDNVIQQTKSKCLEYEKIIRDNTEKILELNNMVQDLKKDKMALEERVSLSESLANKHNEAAMSTSEQLFKANQIISKLNTDLLEMKDKLLCRTAIALEQEKVIDKDVKEMEDLKAKLQNSETNLSKVTTEMENLKEKLEANEKNLKDKEETIRNNNLVIQWLHKKMEDGCVPNRAVYSTPHQKQFDTSEQDSGDIPDFYATSGVSEMDSPVSEVVYSKSGRNGLDPKYLHPSTDNPRKGKPISQPSQPGGSQQNKGKENANLNLPKVFYREKKSAKTTQRTTPVSAYFP